LTTRIANCTKSLLIALVTLFSVGMMIPVVATADSDQCAEWVAKVVSMEGRVESRPDGESNWHPVTIDDTYCAGDELRTLENSRAALQFQNETIVRLDENSMIKILPMESRVPTLLRLLFGKAFFMTRFSRPLTIETPYVNAASGGTEYVIEVNEADGTTTVKVIEGTVNLDNGAGQLVLTDGQSSLTRSGEAPVTHLAVTPKDALQWALYYPPVLSINDLHLSAGDEVDASGWQEKVKESITSYTIGDSTTALDAVTKEPVNVQDPRFYVYRASLYLSVGSIDDARTDITRALELSPGEGLAVALQSIIAVVQNEPDTALKLALDATQVRPESASVQIALSYAYQANTNLPEALTAARTATEIEPQNALAWARTAELWMSQGYLDEALDAANQAKALNPDEVRYLTVLGFAYLTQIRIAEAQDIFEKAVQLNSADPMPRLGLGLTKIRQGDLKAGRIDLEIAAALDPIRALFRSYLGKAYYEEKRDSRSATQFDLAKKLDPKDPTAYTYDAVRKQTTNRPVEALHDFDTAIELNDNRAVYRSRLLLDSDLASRSVSRGRTYQALGFRQQALIEGWKSVNTDPTNYSAHRFLADTYAVLPQSEIARQSALLTSQLLQPINHNPVQPGLSTDSLLQAGSGEFSIAFNEYSQLFEQNEVQLTVSGLAGGDNTRGGELIANGVHGKYSWSLGQFRYLTDGYRENANIDQTLYDLFVQGQFTPKLSLQAESRSNDVENGYLTLLYDPDVYIPTYHRDTQDRTYRVGLKYAPRPTSNILFSALYLDHDEETGDSGVFQPGLGSSATGGEKNQLYEAQFLTDIDKAKIIAGTGYYSGDTNADLSLFADNPLGGTIILNQLNEITETKHTNAYLYALIALSRELQLTIGGSYDRIRDDKLGVDNQFNPKAGILWDINSSTTLRLVGLEVFTRDIVSNQTIEPTQVAGFQQFFDDIPGSDSELYGVGMDYQFSSNAASGIEYTDRNITSPLIDASGVTPIVIHSTIKKKTGRAYYYLSPSDHIATTVDYFYESTKEDVADTNLATQLIPIGVKLFYPNGFFAGLTGSYVDQDGDVLDPVSNSLVSISNHFWTFDTSIGYRLPKRRGIVNIGIQNLTDHKFNLQQGPSGSDDPNVVPLIQPERFVFGKITLVFD